MSRLLVWVFGGAGLATLGAEAQRAADGGGFMMRPLGQLWFDIHRESLNTAQAIVQRYLLPEIWDPAITSILQVPALVVFAALAMFFGFFAMVGARRRARSERRERGRRAANQSAVQAERGSLIRRS